MPQPVRTSGLNHRGNVQHVSALVPGNLNPTTSIVCLTFYLHRQTRPKGAASIAIHGFIKSTEILVSLVQGYQRLLCHVCTVFLDCMKVLESKCSQLAFAFAFAFDVIFLRLYPYPKGWHKFRFPRSAKMTSHLSVHLSRFPTYFKGKSCASEIFYW